MPTTFMTAGTSSKIKEPGVGSKVFETRGDHTFTVPTGVTEIYVAVFGAGGSGAYTTGANATGGGGGGFAGGWLTGVTPGSTYSVTVGAGGELQTTNGSDGNDGGTSSFGAIFSATGGSGGKYAANNESPAGGAGGAGSISGDVLYPSTASGGRGGSIFYISGTGNKCWTGGGASGSPLGDGGRGGDIYSVKSGGDVFTGGGGWANGHGGDMSTQLSTGTTTTGGGGAMQSAAHVHSNSNGYHGTGGSPYGGGNIAVTNQATPVSQHANLGYPPTYFNLLHGRLFGSHFVYYSESWNAIGVGGFGTDNNSSMGGMCAGNSGQEHSLFVNGTWFQAFGGGNGLYVFANAEYNTYPHTFAAGAASGGGGISQSSYFAGGGEGIVFVLW